MSKHFPICQTVEEEFNFNDESQFLENTHTWLNDPWRLSCLDECDLRTAGRLKLTALRDKVREVYGLQIANVEAVTEAIKQFRKNRHQVSLLLLERTEHLRPRAAKGFDKWLESQRKTEGWGL